MDKRKRVIFFSAVLVLALLFLAARGPHLIGSAEVTTDLNSKEVQAWMDEGAAAAKHSQQAPAPVDPSVKLLEKISALETRLNQLEIQKREDEAKAQVVATQKVQEKVVEKVTTTTVKTTSSITTKAPTAPPAPAVAPTPPAPPAPAVAPSPPAKKTIEKRAHEKPEKFLFTYYQSKEPTYGFQALNLLMWAHLLPDWKLVILNDTIMSQWIPDLPAEFYTLEGAGAGAKSDVARAGVLYHHGGLYFDTDIIIANGTLMREWTNKLNEGYEIISYGGWDTKTEDEECELKRSHQWSSNCMGASKKNPYMETWWKNIRSKFARKCKPGEMKIEKICCHVEGEPDPPSCHIPWGYIEHMKAYDHDKEGPEHPMPIDAGYDHKELTYCMNGLRNFIVHSGGETFWEPYSQVESQNACYQVAGTPTLACPHRKKDGSHKIQHYFSRAAFHLFASTMPHSLVKVSVRQVLESNTVLAEILRRSIGIKASTPIDEQIKIIMSPPKPAP
jgi:hypothetical protein